ncbi:MAG: IS1096 element passenger TnpR family protein [Bacteroidota bacterium]
MPVVYRFKVMFEDHEDIIRDIEITNLQTFEDFHTIIQSSVGFDASKPASFFICTDHWLKEQEIVLEARKDNNGQDLPLMKDSLIKNHINDPHQKMMYVFDYDANWSFFVELSKIIPAADEKRMYPVCVKSIGDAPKQYKPAPVGKVKLSPEDTLASLLLADETMDDEPEEDELSDDLMNDTEDGVEADEIEGMNEEGEEDENNEEENGEENYNDSDDQQEDY